MFLNIQNGNKMRVSGFLRSIFAVAICCPLWSYATINELTRVPPDQQFDDRFNNKYENVLAKTVSGTVTDEKKLPVAGVSVRLKGSKNGTVTNAEGRYVLKDIPDNGGILVFSSLGFISKEVPVTGTTV